MKEEKIDTTLMGSVTPLDSLAFSHKLSGLVFFLKDPEYFRGKNSNEKLFTKHIGSVKDINGAEYCLQCLGETINVHSCDGEYIGSCFYKGVPSSHIADEINGNITPEQRDFFNILFYQEEPSNYNLNNDEKFDFSSLN